MPTTPAEPVLTVNQPAANAVVGFNKPFQITGEATDRLNPEPIVVDSVTVQVDSGPIIEAVRKTIPDKSLTRISFSATAQITSGSDPHTVRVVATNDQGLTATKTVTVFAGPAFQVDAPAVLLDILSFISIKADDPQVLKVIGAVQQLLKSVSDSLASAGKVLIGPNLIVQNFGSGSPQEYLVRVGFWIEDPSFTVVPPSADFPLPRLTDAAAAAAFAQTPMLSVPNAGFFPSFALSIPVTTLQHIIDAATPALKAETSKQGFTTSSITVQTSSPAAVNTTFNGTIEDGIIPASFTITETVGLQAVFDSGQMAPAVLKTDTSSSAGSLVEWIVGVLIPAIGAILFYAWHKLSVGVSGETGLAGTFLGSIPDRIPFGNKAISLDSGFKMPDFPTFNFYWSSFAATASGLLGAGTTQIEARTQDTVKVILDGPDSFTGLQDNIIEFTDPVMGYILENITPDTGKFGWQISGAGTNADSLDPPSPVGQAGDFNPHFPLPKKVSVGDYNFNLAISAVETCQSDSSKTLSGAASKAVHFHVKKGAQG